MTVFPASHPSLDRPSAWVERFAGLVPGGEVLDLACGSGRHARLFASQGHRVVALDRDQQVLQQAAGTGIETVQLDLEGEGAAWPFAENRFSGIVVTNYLHRPLFQDLFRSLAEGGVLIYETFAVGNEHFGKPSNPAFLLRRRELLDRVSAADPDGRSLHIVAFEDACIDAPRPAVVQRICVVKTVPGTGVPKLPGA